MGMETEDFLARFCTIAANDGRKGLFIQGSSDGVCPFLEGDVCSIHECKPRVCTIFPDNDGYVTVRRLKADAKSATVRGTGLSRCAIWDLPDAGVLAPNVEASALFRIGEDTDAQYFACHDTIGPDTVDYLARLAELRSTELPLYLLVSKKYGLMRQFHTGSLRDIASLIQVERDILYRYCGTYAEANMLPEGLIECRGVRATFVDGHPGIMVICDHLPADGGEAHFLWRRYGETGIFAVIVEGGGIGEVTAFTINTPCIDDIVRERTLHLAFSDGKNKVAYACREGIL